jgi:hypothetical protein
MKNYSSIYDNEQSKRPGVQSRIQIIIALAIAIFWTTGCAKPPKKVLATPAELKATIEKSVLSKGYAIYANDHLTKVEDLSDTVLFACGCGDEDIDATLAIAFYEALKKPLFRSSEVLGSSDNVSCPGSDACITSTSVLHFSQDPQVPGPELKRTSMWYGKSTSRSALTKKCLDRARAAGKSVIILPTDTAIRSRDGIVELVFK